MSVKEVSFAPEGTTPEEVLSLLTHALAEYPESARFICAITTDEFGNYTGTYTNMDPPTESFALVDGLIAAHGEDND